ncbi:hypothetical protein IE077_003725, partial [Cardiosporidium cionae]
KATEHTRKFPNIRWKNSKRSGDPTTVCTTTSEGLHDLIGLQGESNREGSQDTNEDSSYRGGVSFLWTIRPMMNLKSGLLKNSTQDILDTLLPPRKIKKNGKILLQRASPIPASRSDVTMVNERLDSLLLKNRARRKGICSIRADLFSKCFDEVIRQVTIENPARAILLLKVRDELYHNLEAYKELLNSSMQYYHLKDASSMEGLDDLEKDAISLECTNKELTNQVNFLQESLKETTRNDEETIKQLRNHHADEVNYFYEQQKQYELVLQKYQNEPSFIQKL